MSKFNLFLVNIFYFFIIVIVAELFYFMGLQNNQIFTQAEKTTQSDLSYKVVQDTNKAFNSLLLDTLKTIKKDAVISGVLKLTYEGQVISIKIPARSELTSTRSRIQIKGKKEITNLYYNYSDMKKMVFVTPKIKENKFTLEDLKVGDKIRVEEVIDITKDWSNATKEVIISIL